MLKKGFTLAEVLVTLGIIGIIAALTLPGLQKRAGVAHLGPQLAKAIATLENGMGVLLYEANVKDTTQIQESDTDFGTAKKSGGLLTKLKEGKYVKLTEGSVSGTFPSTEKCAKNPIYALPDKSLVAACTTDAVLTVADGGSTEWMIISAQSRNYASLVEGLDYFKIKISADGMIFIPGSGSCSRTSGGSGCASKIANNGWRSDGNVYKD